MCTVCREKETVQGLEKGIIFLAIMMPHQPGKKDMTLFSTNEFEKFRQLSLQSLTWGKSSKILPFTWIISFFGKGTMVLVYLRNKIKVDIICSANFTHWNSRVLSMLGTFHCSQSYPNVFSEDRIKLNAIRSQYQPKAQVTLSNDQFLWPLFVPTLTNKCIQFVSYFKRLYL